MTQNYDQEMFDFFTSEEAFINLCKIADHLPEIKSQLLHDFWDNVENRLKVKFAEEGSTWLTKRVEPLTSNISKLLIFKEEWGLANDSCPQLAISCERLTKNPFYGTFVHNRVPDLEHKNATAYLRNLAIAKAYQTDNTTWYPFWDFTELTLAGPESFVDILPAKQQATVDALVDKLYDLVKSTEREMDFVHNNFRIQSKVLG